MECHMLYVKSRKSFKVRRQKKFYCFAVCQKKVHGKIFLCRVSKKTHGKVMLCRVSQKSCAKKKHTANHDFAVCFSFVVCFLEHTRQNSCLPCACEFAHGKPWGTRQKVSGSEYLPQLEEPTKKKSQFSSPFGETRAHIIC